MLGDIIFAQLACPLNEVIFTNIEYYSVSLALLTFWSGGTPVLLASSVPASLTSERRQIWFTSGVINVSIYRQSIMLLVQCCFTF